MCDARGGSRRDDWRITCVQVGMGTMDCYTEDFEKFLLSETAAFYKKKAAAWIVVRARSASASARLLL